MHRQPGSVRRVALIRGVERFRADPGVAKAFASDGRLAGRVSIPVLTVHAINDPIGFVEQDSIYREVMDRGGSGPRLVQTWTDEHRYSYMSSPEYAALLAALVKWIDADPGPAVDRDAMRSFFANTGR